jgi:hypothetical protein
VSNRFRGPLLRGGGERAEMTGTPNGGYGRGGGGERAGRRSSDAMGGGGGGGQSGSPFCSRLRDNCIHVGLLNWAGLE